ncbi:MAG: hypothetical protein Crog4KO_36660 [Crocinitomicaceae bacterium]
MGIDAPIVKNTDVPKDEKTKILLETQRLQDDLAAHKKILHDVLVALHSVDTVEAVESRNMLRKLVHTELLFDDVIDIKP